jgi:hypothetical protein
MKRISFGVGLSPFDWRLGWCDIITGNMLAIGPIRLAWRGP